jgi:hypothetical protein
VAARFFVLAPENGRFVDGNPVGGTIVAAAFLNAVLGEIQALLALEGVELQSSGALPGDHQQLALMFAAAWVRIRATGTYPESAASNSILIDPAALLAGNWPFRIYQDGAWETPPTPLAVAGDGGEEEGGEEAPQGITEVTDAIHGQRGGGDLHALATATRSGFLSPQGYQLLLALGETYPEPAESGWLAVAAGQTYTWSHGLEQIPGALQFWFRRSPTAPPRLVNTYFNVQQQFVGVSPEHTSPTVLTYTTGDRVWGGYTSSGYQEFSSGEYLIKAVANGG